MEFNYFDKKHAIQVQHHIIKHSGGREGVLNADMLGSILEFIKSDLYYPNLEDKVCHLFFSINKNHVFSDGNKRSSIALSAYLLEINGQKDVTGKYIREMENIAVHVAENKIKKDLLHEIICEIMYRSEYSEQLRLKLIRALI